LLEVRRGARNEPRNAFGRRLRRRGVAQDPYNKSYTYENASVGTKTDTPVMETPLDVVSVTQQVLKDQQVTTLAQALQNVSGVTVDYGSGFANGYPSAGIDIRGFSTNGNIYRDGFRVDGAANYVPQQMANVQSVEVLKGAAAILLRAERTGRPRQRHHQAAARLALFCGEHAGRLPGAISHDDRRHWPSQRRQVAALSD